MTPDFSTDLRDELGGLDPSERAFRVLLQIAAWGFHDSNRDELRQMTKAARERYRAATPAPNNPEEKTMTEKTPDDVRRELADEFETRARLAADVDHLGQATFVWLQAARIARGETVEVAQ